MTAAPACPAYDPPRTGSTRPDPETVTEVLEWAPFPLATVEVAAVCGRDVRAELARVAHLDAGYWSLP
jgi:hypothetical protein